MNLLLVYQRSDLRWAELVAKRLVSDGHYVKCKANMSWRDEWNESLSSPGDAPERWDALLAPIGLGHLFDVETDADWDDFSSLMSEFSKAKDSNVPVVLVLEERTNYYTLREALSYFKLKQSDFSLVQELHDPRDDAALFSAHIRALTRRLEGSVTDESEPPLVFLCHSHGDKSEVRGLYERLVRDSVRCWLDEENIIAGQNYDLEIRKAIRSSTRVIACLSKSSITKAGYVQKELKRALDLADEQPEGSIFLIPVRLEPCEVPDRLSHLSWVDLFEPDGYRKLLRALSHQTRVV